MGNDQANWDALNARIDAFERKVDERSRLIDEGRKRLVVRYFSVAIGVAIVHFFSGLDVLVGGGTAVLITTPLAFLSLMFDFYVPVAAASHAYMIAVIFIVAAVMAVIPFLIPTTSRWLFMALLAPQQALLLSHLLSIQIALFAGHYADGYVPKGGAYFIFADQIWLLMVIFYHTLEYVETYKMRVVAELIPVSPRSG